MHDVTIHRIRAWTAANQRARDDYYKYPTVSRPLCGICGKPATYAICARHDTKETP